MTYKEAVVKALQLLNGQAYLKDIYNAFELVYDKPLVKNYQAGIRSVLETHSSDSEAFDGENLFYSVDGLRNGHWGLRGFNQNFIADHKIEKSKLEKTQTQEDKKDEIDEKIGITITKEEFNSLLETITSLIETSVKTLEQAVELIKTVKNK